MQKNKGVLAAITVVISQVIFYKLIDAVGNSDSDLTMYAIAVASGVGTYLAVKLNDKFSKERTFVNVILSDNREAMEELREYLREHKITNLATEAFTKEWDKTIAITAYAETKEDGKQYRVKLTNSGEPIPGTEKEIVIVPDDNEKDDVVAEETKGELEYFINAKSVKKVKEISGETTVFNLHFKLFVMNDSGATKTILTNAFSASYDIGEFGSLYTFTCNEEEKYFSLGDGEVIDLDFTLKYIVTNTDEFLDFEKYDLVINYMLEEILSFNV